MDSRLNQNDLSKKNLREKIESYEARLKENDLDRDFYEKELKELKEFQPLLKHDLNNTLDFYYDYSKEYFKNETELYILVSARDNKGINSAIKKHYGYDRGMYMSARTTPCNNSTKKQAMILYNLMKGNLSYLILIRLKALIT